MRGSTRIQHQSDCGLAEGDPSVIGQRDEVLGRSDLLLTALGAPGEPLGHALQHILFSPPFTTITVTSSGPVRTEKAPTRPFGGNDAR